MARENSSKRAPNKRLPSLKYLNECLICDAEAGTLTWRERPRRHFKNNAGWVNFNRNAGQLATHIQSSGYVTLKIYGVNYLAHRVIWKMVTGKEPPKLVDHIDRDKTNNRWVNLREASAAENKRNQHLYASNSSGYSGIYPVRSSWLVRISVNKRRHNLGTYPTLAEAIAVRLAAEKTMWS
jgi:hypothetical protein